MALCKFDLILMINFAFEHIISIYSYLRELIWRIIVAYLGFVQSNFDHCFNLIQSPERTLDAPDLVDDYYLNLLDWGSCNILAIALLNSVYLWDARDGSTSELVTVDDESGPVTSVSWACDGRHIAIGLNNSNVQLWDSASTRLVRH